MSNLVKSREVKSFTRTFTGAFTQPQEIEFQYYWRDEHSVSLVMHPWGPYPQNSVDVLIATEPFPTELIPIKNFHTTGMGMMDNITQGAGALVMAPEGILINSGVAPYTFSGVGDIVVITQAETTLLLI